VVEKFLENSFTTTSFTRRIKNINWMLGDSLAVIGQNTSLITQDSADKRINADRFHMIGSDTKIQNRQVEAK